MFLEYPILIIHITDILFISPRTLIPLDQIEYINHSPFNFWRRYLTILMVQRIIRLK